MSNNLDRVAVCFTAREIGFTVKTTLSELRSPNLTPDHPDFEDAADRLEFLATVQEWQAGREEAEEGLLRTIVRERMRPAAYVAIPGLKDVCVPVFEDQLAGLNPAAICRHPHRIAVAS